MSDPNEPPPPAGYKLRDSGEIPDESDLWLDRHTNRWRHINPQSTVTPVQDYERIATKDQP